MKPACLIAEHNLPVATLLRGFAERYGLRVLHVSEGDRVLELTLELQPAVIFIDVLLPGKMRGFTVIRNLKENPKTSGVPTVALLPDSEGELHGLATGANACLISSMNYQGFLAALTQAGVFPT
jgi:two-component system response regulator AdeR